MYPPKEFRETDRGRIVQFIRDFPLATMTTMAKDGWPVATHVPVLLDDDGESLSMRGHVMRKTDHWQAFHANPQVLAVFHGPNCPVLASWYPETDNGGTWNYMVVQAHGTLDWLAPEELLSVLRELKDGFEGTSGFFDALSGAYLDRLVPAIEGFRLRFERVEAVFKLSQNRDDASFTNIVRELSARGGQSVAVADAMRSYRPHLDLPG